MLYLPPGYQSGSKLPMLVEVYGGPGFQKVPIATIVFPLNLTFDFFTSNLRWTSSGKDITGRPMWRALWESSTLS